MSGFSIGGFQFGRSNANVVPPSTPPAQAQMIPKNDGNPPPNGGNEPDNNPNNNADPNKGKTPDSPLDNYADLFKVKVDDKGQPIAPQADPLAAPIINFDPEAIKKTLAGKHLVGNIDQELMQKAMSGQDPQAFMQVLNQVVNTTLNHSIAITANMAENAIKTNNERFERALPDRIRTTQIHQSQSKNPALSHPAVAPMVAALKVQIAQQNPHLPPDRVQDMAENYWIEASKAIQGNDPANVQAAQQKTKASEGPDWGNLLLDPQG